MSSSVYFSLIYYVNSTSVASPAAAVVVVEASVPEVYPRVTLVSVSTLSGSMVRAFRGGEGLPNMFCQVASSLGQR